MQITGGHVCKLQTLNDILHRMEAHQSKKSPTFRPLAVANAFSTSHGSRSVDCAMCSNCKQERQSFGYRVAHHLWRGLIRNYLASFHRLKVQGRENVPQDPPYILVGNHASHLDALVLASVLPSRMWDHIYPLAAKDTCFEPPSRAAFLACVVNALPIDRRKTGHKSLLELRRRLGEEPCVYIVFPEGTRTRTGQMAHFKGGIGFLVAETKIPVVPCFVQGAYEALPPNCHCPRLRPITLRIGSPLMFSEVRHNRRGWREVARQSEAAVRRLSP